jgi:hypothetical protein
VKKCSSVCEDLRFGENFKLMLERAAREECSVKSILGTKLAFDLYKPRLARNTFSS